MKLAFVCTGNICRSPMAEYMLKDRMSDSDREKIDVTSAGVAARAGNPPSQPAVEVLKEIGIEAIAMHSASPVRDLDLGKDDLILTMTGAHLSRLPKRYRDSSITTDTIKEFVGQSGSISDPYGAPVERYRELRKELDPLLDDVYQRLREGS